MPLLVVMPIPFEVFMPIPFEGFSCMPVGLIPMPFPVLIFIARL